MEALSLVVRRTIRAPADRLFEMWTAPDHVERWWGPKGVRCVGVEIDLRVGGTYRIGNEMPDGSIMWIRGEFERIDPPSELVYTWRIDESRRDERVTVRFEASGDATDVVVVHERIVDEAARDQHELGWIGCLDGLVAHVER